jgi:hypothetical protein
MLTRRMPEYGERSEKMTKDRYIKLKVISRISGQVFSGCATQKSIKLSWLGWLFCRLILGKRGENPMLKCGAKDAYAFVTKFERSCSSNLLPFHPYYFYIRYEAVKFLDL